jgi:hypothetical protein
VVTILSVYNSAFKPLSFYPRSSCSFHKMSFYRRYGNILIKLGNNRISYGIQHAKELTVNEHKTIYVKLIKYLRKNTLSAITVMHMHVQSFQAEVISSIFRRQISGVRPKACVVILLTEASKFCKIYSSINLISSLSTGI